MQAHDLINTTLYPLHSSSSVGYQEFVAAARESFEAEGVALLPNFLSPQGLLAIREEVVAVEHQAFFCRNEHNVYLDASDMELGEDHPRNRRLRTSVGSIANDYLPKSGSLQRLYDTTELTQLIAEIVGAPELFVSDDPLGALSVNVYRAGDGHAWHFDESRFSVTLMLRRSSEGGAFEYVRGLRDEGDGDVTAISRYLDGGATAATRMPFDEGTLAVFAGRHTMHRVTAAGGDQARLVPVLTYADAPGYHNSDEVREFFWGRAS